MLFIPGYDSPELIGRGGFAHVYRAHQQAFDRVVAVKILLVSLDHERDRRRFERECSAMGRLTGHPHIVTVLESGVTPDGNPYLTTPFYENGTLADRLAADGPADVDETLATGVALAGALDIAHGQGILHRDLKPANILLSAYGEPALADFGIAVIAAESTELSQVTHAFTITHAPPEILDGRRATEATDVYSLASTLWTMLTGSPPFGNDDGGGLAARVQRVQNEPVPPLGRDDAPASLEAELRGALSKRPEDRPTARQFGERLRAIQHERGTAMTPMRSGAETAVATNAAMATPRPDAAAPTGTVAWPGADAVRWADDPIAPMSAGPTPSTPSIAVEPSVAAATPSETAPGTPRPSIAIDPPATAPVPAPTGAPPPSRPSSVERPRHRALLLVAAALVVLVGFVGGTILALDRSGDDRTASDPTTTVPVSSAAPTGATPPTTPTPTTAAPATPVPAPAGPATAILAADAPGRVRNAAATAQDAANALAAGDWDQARRHIPSLAGASDAELAQAWGMLDRSTLVVVDWDERGPATVLRLGQVAEEQVGGADRTSLYCVTWTVRGDAVADMADQQVVAAPWQAGSGDPAAAAAVLADGCRSL
jgi:serine/threonine-protein kinase PknK